MAGRGELDRPRPCDAAPPAADGTTSFFSSPANFLRRLREALLLGRTGLAERVFGDGLGDEERALTPSRPSP